MNDQVPSLPAVLTFAASDPTSGAGLQADLLALASMGCYPLSVVTAITVQDTAGVESVLAIDPDWVADQARCLLEDMPVAAFKMGMLGSTEIVTVVAEIVSDYPDVPLVLDPVFSLRQRVRIAPGKSARVAFWTLVAPSRDELVLLIDKHHDRNAFDRAKTLAWTQAQVQLHHLGIEGDEAHPYFQGRLCPRVPRMMKRDSVARRRRVSP